MNYQHDDIDFEMKKLLVIGLVLFAGFFTAQAQDYYKTAVGLRFGAGTGLTIKHFTSSSTALEGIVISRWRGMMITGLCEYEKIAWHTPGLSWYAGGGGHIGFWNNYYEGNSWWDQDEHPDGYTVLGADFILGLEYTVREFPLNFSIDWKPALNFIGYTGFWPWEIGLSIRYGFRY
jgi:hypothetical protein